MVLKKRVQFAAGLSFHSGELIATYSQLKDIYGEPGFINSEIDGSHVVWIFWLVDKNEKHPVELYNVHKITNVNEPQLWRVLSENGINGLLTKEIVLKELENEKL